MPIYVDTSVLVPLFVNEPMSEAVVRWYEACDSELVSAAWCVTEFASALGLKQRRNDINAEQAAIAWQGFERLCAHDMQLLPIDPPTFHHAATLTFDAKAGLRAGDALHLAAAVEGRAASIATLDVILAQNAKRVGIDAVTF